MDIADASQPIAPYGTWPSKLGAEHVVGHGIGLAEVRSDGERLYWLEERPAEKGRSALMTRGADGSVGEVFDGAIDVGTRVHEYGGGAYDAAHGVVVASARDDGRVLVASDSASRTLAAVPGCRFSDFTIAREGRIAYAVREDHRDRPPTDPETTLVLLDLASSAPPDRYAGEIVVAGADFYLQPSVSHDGSQLAWLEWDHPAMPWDGTRLRVAALDAAGHVVGVRTPAEGEGEAISHLVWAADGTLYFTSDRSGWWNLYAYDGERVREVVRGEFEIGAPLWVGGTRVFCVLDDGSIAVAYVRGARSALAVVEEGRLRDVAVPGPGIAGSPVAHGRGVAAIVAPDAAPAAIVAFESVAPGAQPAIARSREALPIGDGDIARPVALEIPTPDGDVTHAFFYAPRSTQVRAPANELPPLVLMAHGGPTAAYPGSFDARVQWWTTRGFAVAHVNYRGSTGFGTAYRRKLNGRWCDIDVLDAIGVAQYLTREGLVDPKRLAIRGGSASGTWALLAIASSKLFACATSEFGVTDLELLAGETHKFESRYMDSMIGPLPQTRERYRARSPIERVADISVPVLLLQGLDDKVVPPNQAETMRDALRARGVDVDYHAYEGEGHGFRKSENIRDALEREAAFYRRVFGISQARVRAD